MLFAGAGDHIYCHRLGEPIWSGVCCGWGDGSGESASRHTRIFPYRMRWIKSSFFFSREIVMLGSPISCQLFNNKMTRKPWQWFSWICMSRTEGNTRFLQICRHSDALKVLLSVHTKISQQTQEESLHLAAWECLRGIDAHHYRLSPFHFSGWRTLHCLIFNQQK